jgi:hypothetical protein
MPILIQDIEFKTPFKGVDVKGNLLDKSIW